MRYFIFTRKTDKKCWIWEVRKDGMERCLSDPTDDLKNWNNPIELGYPNVLELVNRKHNNYGSWREVSKEEAFLELL